MKKTKLSTVVKTLRKEYGLTQEDLALKSGVGLCFVRNLEQGKPTLRMDKVNQLLDLFNYEIYRKDIFAGILTEDGGNTDFIPIFE